MYTLDNFQNGQILLVNKPLEWTSFQVVNKIHWLIRKQYDIKKIKVGHAGTLDPLATGLLLICTGKKTKEIQGLIGTDKTYTGTICLGATTPSYDLETAVIPQSDPSGLNEKELKDATKTFLGRIQQKPPIFSAIKQKGKRLYEHARAGEKVAILGRMGSGKSTIARLLSGLYEPDVGSILLDGVDLRQIDQADIRKNVGSMLQETWLFSGSVKENIQMGFVQYDDEHVLKVSKISGVDDFLFVTKYSKIQFDKPQKFSFNIPQNYEEIP